MPDTFQIPELNAAEDALMQAERAGFNPLDPMGVLSISDVVSGKRALHAYVMQLDQSVRGCPDTPPALLSSYRAWRAQWDAFYNRTVWPWTVAKDVASLNAHKAQAADFADRLSAYCQVPEIPSTLTPAPPGGGGGILPDLGGGGVTGTVDRTVDAIKTVAIVGGVIALVVVVGVAYVASKTVPANIRAGGELLRRNPRRRRRR